MRRDGVTTTGFAVWIGVAILTVAVVGLGVWLSAKPKPVPPPNVEKPVAVRLLTLTPRRQDDVSRLTGRVLPRREAVLGVEEEGVITERLADAGDRVSAGQTLLRVDSRLSQAVRRQAEIEAADAARDLRRLRDLGASGAVSTADREAAESREARAQVALDEARTRLEQCAVRAPFDGVIDARWVEAGEFAARGKAAFRLVDLGGAKLRVAVPERDVAAVRADALVPFTLAAVPERVYTGCVSFVSLAADEGSNAFDVELRVDNADGRLRAGMIAEVALTRRQREAALVAPLAAVVPSKGENVVFLEQGGRAVRRVVQLERAQGSETVLTAGVVAGDRLVVEGQRMLQDGALLDVRAEPLPERE